MCANNRDYGVVSKAECVTFKGIHEMESKEKLLSVLIKWFSKVMCVVFSFNNKFFSFFTGLRKTKQNQKKPLDDAEYYEFNVFKCRCEVRDEMRRILSLTENRRDGSRFAPTLFES